MKMDRGNARGGGLRSDRAFGTDIASLRQDAHDVVSQAIGLTLRNCLAL